MKFLITGGNSGLGYHTAEQLLKEPGNEVWITSRDQANGEEALLQLQRISNSSSTVHLIRLDVTDDDSITTAAALPGLQDLDVLVNNAGVVGDFAPKGSAELRDNLRSVFETNVIGASVITESFIPAMSKSKSRPAIVFVSSGLGSISNRMKNFIPGSDQKGKTNVLAYNASKTALNGVAAYYANDQPRFRIVCVAPGHCSTKLNNHTGPFSAESGAEVIVKAALDTEGASGIFVSRDGVVPW